jgi:hypothetical protein
LLTTYLPQATSDTDLNQLLHPADLVAKQQQVGIT